MKTIPIILFKGISNGIKFTRMQIPLKYVYSGTIHKSQGMTLRKVVIDMRSNFWEHGQLYVALSRVKEPQNVCVLLPELSEEEQSDSEDEIHPIAEKEIVDYVLSIENDEYHNEVSEEKEFVDDSSINEIVSFITDSSDDSFQNDETDETDHLNLIHDDVTKNEDKQRKMLNDNEMIVSQAMNEMGIISLDLSYRGLHNYGQHMLY